MKPSAATLTKMSMAEFFLDEGYCSEIHGDPGQFMSDWVRSQFPDDERGARAPADGHDERAAPNGERQGRAGRSAGR